MTLVTSKVMCFVTQRCGFRVRVARRNPAPAQLADLFLGLRCPRGTSEVKTSLC